MQTFVPLERQCHAMALFYQAFLELAREFLVVLHNQNPHLCACSIHFISEKLMSLPLLRASSALLSRVLLQNLAIKIRPPTIKAHPAIRAQLAGCTSKLSQPK